jgi:predicted glycogen debranching enzyme
MLGEDCPAHARREWLLTNGLGGFAMGSADGRPDRRYHAWLIAATAPPVGRIVALHSCASWLVCVPRQGRPGELTRYPLSPYRFADGAQSDGAFGRGRFTCNPAGAEASATWRCVVEHAGMRIRVEQTLALHDGAREGVNGASVHYIAGLDAPVRTPELPFDAWIEVRPFTPLRDFHAVLRRHDGEGAFRVTTDTVPADAAAAPGAVVRIIERGGRRLMLASMGGGRAVGEFIDEPQWWYNFGYSRDEARGQGEPEDQYSPGFFRFALSPSAAFVTKAHLHARLLEPANASLRRASPDRIERLGAMTCAVAQAGVKQETPGLAALVSAADQFLVARRPRAGATADQTDQATASAVIAGYPWFSDWGRDTCISLPGLMLATGRHADALASLVAFASLRKDGLIPNCFDDASGHAEYNTADASLHFLRAAAAYARESKDLAGFTAHLLPACLDVIDAYRSGTDFGIRVDPADGLVCAGDASTQLTWMDARRDGVVFTPRHGKPVELSALWYSALLELAALLERAASARARDLRSCADVTLHHFASSFWNAGAGCLFDCLTPAWGRFVPDVKIRPNQIFAVSLPHCMLTPEQRASVLAVVERDLLTPQGLRTLSPGDPDYRARYEGNLFERDRAYHNGTVWPWLIGPYVEGVLRTGSFSPGARSKARAAIAPLLMRFSEPSRFPGEPLLQLSEVYDADNSANAARRADGCPGQAWSVAELLRALVLCEQPGPDVR